VSGRVADKVAIVTGGARGIGESMVRALHREGAIVVVADRSGGESALVEELGERALAINIDVRDVDGVAAMVDHTVEEFGRLDILCNNAGIEGDIGLLTTCTPENFENVVAINLRGTFVGMQRGIEAMLRTGGGSIINTSSASGLVGFPQLALYSATKAAILGLTRTAAAEYARAGIRVNAICPGLIRTPLFEQLERDDPAAFAEFIGAAEAMTAMGRVGNPDEIGSVAVFLGSDESSYLTGASIPVDGGYTAV